jgi:hypothetical protein
MPVGLAQPSFIILVRIWGWKKRARLSDDLNDHLHPFVFLFVDQASCEFSSKELEQIDGRGFCFFASWCLLKRASKLGMAPVDFSEKKPIVAQFFMVRLETGRCSARISLMYSLVLTLTDVLQVDIEIVIDLPRNA